MDPNVWSMLLAMTVAIFNFWVALINLQFDKPLAKFFVCANLVFGVMNTATAIKYLLR